MKKSTMRAEHWYDLPSTTIEAVSAMSAIKKANRMLNYMVQSVNQGRLGFWLVQFIHFGPAYPTLLQIIKSNDK